MSSPILPLEGVTVEFLVRPLRTILLQPLLTAGLLLASWRKPQDVRRALAVISKDRVSFELFNRTVKTLLAAGVLYRLNNMLTSFTLNNFKSDRSWDWQKEIVVVTGGCSGIGQLTARKLSERNVKVVVLDVAEPRSALPANTFFYKVDITSSKQISETAQKIRQDVGEPTVLVNNAGVGFCLPILEEPEERIRQTFEVNIVAHFLLVKEFVPHMIKHNHGHIVTIASLASFLVHASNVDYACTKSAALAFHEGLAQELKSRYSADRVRTTVVHPTWVRTPLIEMLSRKEDFKEFVLDPDTVASAVVAQVLRGESAQLIIPGRFSLVTTARGWPSWLQEGLRNSVADLLRPAA